MGAPHECLRARIRRRRQALPAGREHRAPLPLRPRGGPARPPRRRRLAGEEGAAQGAHPRHGGPADPHRRRARAAQGRGPHPARPPRLGGVLRPLPLRRDRRPARRHRRRARATWSPARPMDRLVCGDVGFGKTEVALRAAFVAAMSGMQVAVIAPTTLLARQHFKNFSERFRGLPFRVRQLSRFVSAKDAAETRAGLADGSIEIVIGTHALLAKSVTLQEPRPPRHRRGAALRRRPQGAAQGAALRRPRPHAHRHPDPAHAAARALRRPRALADRHAAGRPPRDPHLRQRVRPRHRARGAAARALPRRPGVLRRAAHRRPRRGRGVPARAGARGELRRRPRPDAGQRARRADERLLRRPLRRARSPPPSSSPASTSRPPTR